MIALLPLQRPVYVLDGACHSRLLERSRVLVMTNTQKKKKRGSSASLDLGVPLNGWFFIWGLDVSGIIILILTI